MNKKNNKMNLPGFRTKWDTDFRHKQPSQQKCPNTATTKQITKHTENIFVCTW